MPANTTRDLGDMPLRIGVTSGQRQNGLREAARTRRGRDQDSSQPPRAKPTFPKDGISRRDSGARSEETASSPKQWRDVIAAIQAGVDVIATLSSSGHGTGHRAEMKDRKIALTPT